MAQQSLTQCAVEPGSIEPTGSYQDAFVAALRVSPEGPWPASIAHLCVQPGFAIYRNTVMKSCIDALQANYPSIQHMVGTEWFRAAAALYVQAHPPKDARLLHYGGNFASFLAAFEPARPYPYLPAMAELDAAWTQAHVATDAPTLTSAALMTLAQTPEHMRLKPHPAARWMHHQEHPVDTLWQRARARLGEEEQAGGQTDEEPPVLWRGEATLITRPVHTVQWTSWSEAGCAFLTACAAGELFEEACAEALRVDPALNLGELVAGLLQAGALEAPPNV
jgi:Putative DNA-binding domain